MRSVVRVLLPACCPICDRPGQAPCGTCLAGIRAAPPMPPPPGLDACRALLVYDGAARRIVTRLKYGHHRVALGWLADGLAGLMVPPPGVVVTWAPTTALRRRRRGFDQSQLIASAVARRWGVPRRRLLERAPGPAQTGRPLIDRSTGPRLAARRVTRGPVIVVDDVVTTGATLTAAAGALRSAGATWVGAVVVAHTPRRAGENG